MSNYHRKSEKELVKLYNTVLYKSLDHFVDLPKDIRKSIDEYTMPYEEEYEDEEDEDEEDLWFPDYVEFNTALRKGLKFKEKIYKQWLKNLDLAFARIPQLEQPLIVYKGKKSEKVYSDKSFVSTSLQFDIAMNFANKIRGTDLHCCVVEITVSPGSKILPIFYGSEYPEEQEILLDRNGEMFVTGSTIEKVRGKKVKIIFATYMPSKSKKAKSDKDFK
jgi:hypothetical protein